MSRTMLIMLLRLIWVNIPTYRMASELDFRGLVEHGTLGLRNLKHRLFLEAEHLGEDIGRERLYRIVQLACSRIEEAAHGSELVLDVGHFLLQLQEILVGLDLGLSLQRPFESGQRSGQRIVGLYLLIYSTRVLRCST